MTTKDALPYSPLTTTELLDRANNADRRTGQALRYATEDRRRGRSIHTKDALRLAQEAVEINNAIDLRLPFA